MSHPIIASIKVRGDEDFIKELVKYFKSDLSDNLIELNLHKNSSPMVYDPDTDRIRSIYNNSGNKVTNVCSANSFKALVEKLDSRNDIDFDYLDINNKTALIYACEHGNLKMVNKLLECGADPNIYHYKSPLMCACVVKNAKIAKALLEAGADPNAQGGLRNYSPLMISAELEDIPMCVLLLQNGAGTTSTVSSEEKHALIYARETKNEELIELFQVARDRGL